MAVEKDVRSELGKLPAELREQYKIIYQDILESAHSTSSIARRTFSWILAAQRMLTVEEMIAAVALDDDGFYHTDLDIARLLDICRNLVIVTSIDYASKQMSFQMVHVSVREFLEELPQFSAEQIHTVAVSRLLSNFRSSLWLEKNILIREKPLRALRNYTIYLFEHARMSLLATPECDLAPKMTSFLFDNQYNMSPMLKEWHHIIDELGLYSIVEEGFSRLLSYRKRDDGGGDAEGLHLVCVHGLLSILHNLGNDGMNPWEAHSSEQLSQALWEATSRRRFAIAKWLLERQLVHPNEFHRSSPALFAAVQNHHEELVSLLLEYGADPLSRHEQGFHKTPWSSVFSQSPPCYLKYPKHHYTIFKRMVDCIELLHKENPDRKSSFAFDWKLEGLFEALRGDWDEASQFWIRHGANDRLQTPKRKSRYRNFYEPQCSALQIAVKYSKLSVIEALLNRCRRCSSSLAAQSISPVQLQSREHLAYVNYIDDRGSSAIHYLTDRQSSDVEDSEEIMRLLLNHGANPTAASEEKHTAIHIAAAIGSTKMIRQLVTEGLDLDVRDNRGATALHITSGSEYRTPGLIRYLTDSGQEPLGKTRTGWTPLHYAAASFVTFLRLKLCSKVC